MFDCGKTRRANRPKMITPTGGPDVALKIDWSSMGISRTMPVALRV